MSTSSGEQPHTCSRSFQAQDRGSLRTSEQILAEGPALEAPQVTVHCKLDKVGHRSLCPPRNGTGVVLLEAGMCRVSLKEMSGSNHLSPYSEMSKTIQLLRSC